MKPYKKISVKILSVLCTAGVITSGFSTMPYSAEEIDDSKVTIEMETETILFEGEEGSIYWKITSGYELVISPRYDGKTGVIPDYYEEYENPDSLSEQRYLERIILSPWSEFSDVITSVKICNGVTSIGGYAFYGMHGLENVCIADSVTYIRKNAFSNTAVKSIKLPENLVSISDYAFSGCTSLREMNLPDSLSCIGSYAFDGCISLTGLDLPAALVTIGEFAFSGCTGLTNLEIPDSVESIGKGAFKDCSGITDIQFGSGITEIPWMGFENCTSITQVVIDNDKTKEVSADAFKGCTALRNVYLGDSVSYIGSSAFSGCPLTELTVCNPDAIISCTEGKIGVDDNSNMTIYGVPESTAWETAQSLGINFSEINGYESMVHKYTDSLTWTIKNGHTLVIEGEGEIPDYEKETVNDCPPWYGYRNIVTEVIIGEGVTRIGDDSMSFAPNISEVSLPSTLKTIGSEAFLGTALEEATVPEKVEFIGERAFYTCKQLKTVNLNCSIKKLESETFSGCISLVNIDIPESVASMGDFAFSSCENLNSIKIPDGVTEISIGSFQSCGNLETVELPETIEKIGSGAFQHCKSLNKINLGDNIYEIGTYAFSDCSSLTEIQFGNNLKEICGSAFEKSGLTGNITIPANVDKIDSYAFLNCIGVESYTILNPDITMISWDGNGMGTISTEDKNNPYVQIPTAFYGYRGSTTEAYANKYSAFTFTALDDMCEKGDVNLDGKVNVSDLVLLQQYLVKRVSLTDEQWDRADILEDGSLNVFDAVLLKRKLIESNEK